MSIQFHFEQLKGVEAKKYFTQLAELRMSVFRDYPYLYDGSLEYEQEYLQTYFSTSDSLITVCFANNKIIGMTTNILMRDEEDAFRRPFEDAGYDTDKMSYLGEILLEKPYRGLGLGRTFMQYAQEYALSFSHISHASLCVVLRPEGHPRCPPEYKNLDGFWQKNGYQIQPDIVTYYRWKDVDREEETIKIMQYWIKQLR